MKQTLKVIHSGKLGDILYALPAMRALAREHDTTIHLYLVPTPDGEWMLTESQAHLLTPLLKTLPYISGVEFLEDMPVIEPQAINAEALNNFRHVAWHGMNLAETHLRCHGLNINEWRRPWLQVEPVTLVAPIIISRTLRYHVDHFPWQQILERYGDRCAFIGLRHEYKVLCQNTGVKIPHHPTADLLEVARVIASSKLHISNQGAAAAISDGMHHTMILSHWGNTRNLFPRLNKWHIDKTLVDLFPWEEVDLILRDYAQPPAQ